MSRPVLILRPQPGAERTRARAGTLGLEAIVAPIFSVEPLAWQAPSPFDFQAVLLTSANAPRLGGEALLPFVYLPAYAVGEATAAAAREAGFEAVHTGASDGAGVLEMMARDEIAAAFHPCGEDLLPLNHRQVRVERRIVYASKGAASLPAAARSALAEGALALLHSPRAASHFQRLVEGAVIAKESVDLVLISEAAASAAGSGWNSKSVAPEPRDHALLELAAKLCKTGPNRMESNA